MVKREYGVHKADYKWSVDAGCGGLVSRVLEVYQTKKCWKGLLWSSNCGGWREEPHQPLKRYEGKTWQDVMDLAGVPMDSTMECPVFHNYGTLKKI